MNDRQHDELLIDALQAAVDVGLAELEAFCG